MAHYTINMAKASTYRTETYGVTDASAFVYKAEASTFPTRLVAWDNTGRPNLRNGQPTRWGNAGAIDGGNGQYLDPNNLATDAPVSVLITPEASVITDSGTNTGTQASGQVYDANRTVLRTGDTLELVYSGMRTETRIVKMTYGGYGSADLI